MLSFTPTVPHSVVPSLDSMSTRVLAAVPLRRVDDAHLVVGQPHVAASWRIERHQRRPQRGVERVDRAVAFGHPVCATRSPTRTLTVASQIEVVAVAAHRHVIGIDDERRRRLRVSDPADEQRQRTVGGFELVALVLEFLDRAPASSRSAGVVVA